MDTKLIWFGANQKKYGYSNSIYDSVSGFSETRIKSYSDDAAESSSSEFQR